MVALAWPRGRTISRNSAILSLCCPMVLSGKLRHGRSVLQSSRSCTTSYEGDDAGYSSSIYPLRGLQFDWGFSQNFSVLNARLTYTEGEVWLAMGTSEDGMMVDSQVILGQLDLNYTVAPGLPNLFFL